MPFGGLLIAGIGLAAGAVESGIQSHKANQIAPKTDPVYTIPPEFYQNREIARQMAELGMPQQQYNNAVNNINQNQAAAIAAAQNSNNPGGAITNIVRQGNQAKAKLDAEDAMARENNQRYFISQNDKVAGQELAKQQSDVFDKFTRDFNQAQAYRAASMQNLNNVISGSQQLAGNYLNYQQNKGTSAPIDSSLTAGPNNPQPQLTGNQLGYDGSPVAPGYSFNPYGTNQLITPLP